MIVTDEFLKEQLEQNLADGSIEVFVQPTGYVRDDDDPWGYTLEDIGRMKRVVVIPDELLTEDESGSYALDVTDFDAVMARLQKLAARTSEYHLDTDAGWGMQSYLTTAEVRRLKVVAGFSFRIEVGVLLEEYECLLSADGNLHIGCRSLSLDAWLGAKGRDVIEENHGAFSSTDRVKQKPHRCNCEHCSFQVPDEDDTSDADYALAGLQHLIPKLREKLPLLQAEQQKGNAKLAAILNRLVGPAPARKVRAKE